MDIIDKIMNEPIFMGLAILIAILVVFSIFKKLFKFLGILIAIVVLYLVYLTQVEGLSYEEATSQAKKVGEEFLKEGQETLGDFQKVKYSV